LSAAKDDSNSEVQAREKLAREKTSLQTDHNELKEKYKVGTVCACVFVCVCVS